jgi:transcriptional regulator with XRE-family HTH domain
VRRSRSTFEAAVAALALVFLVLAMGLSPLVGCVLSSVQGIEEWCQQWCTITTVDDGNRETLLGEELRSARVSASRSLRDVARGAEISAAYLQKLERAQVKEPSPRILRRLSATLGVSYPRLMQVAGYGTPDSGRADPLAFRFASTALTEVEERAVAAFVDHLIAQRPGTGSRRGLS